jgi:hypothetical protein
MKAFLRPEPYARITAGIIMLSGSLLTRDLSILAIYYAIIFATLALQGILSVHIKFLIHIWTPALIGLTFVWGYVVKGSPLSVSEQGVQAGLHFAAITALRLAVIAGLFQTVFLSIKGIDRARFLTALGLSASSVAIVVSVFNLWPQFQRKVELLVAARCARGLMPNRRILTRIKQIPATFRLLFIGSLEESLDRTDRWNSEGLLSRLGKTISDDPEPLGLRKASSIWIFVSSICCCTAILTRILPCCK